jgi:hypothetical protein
VNLLTLDIGITTGWCAFWVDGQPDDEWGMHDYGTIKDEDLGEVLPQLRQEWKPDHVVMEKPFLAHPGPLQRDLQTAVLVATSVFPLHVSIAPAQWKPSPWAKYPLPRGTSPHVRDAVRMGIWWLKSAWDPANVRP